MKKYKILYFFAMIFLCAACEKMVLGPATVNDPINNFELFWQGIDQHSALIFSKNINWDSVYQVYRPQVTEQTNNDGLWVIFVEMIETFDDEHTVIFDGEEKDYTSGAHRIGDAIESFSKDLIRQKYLENFIEFDPIQLAPDFSFGSIKGRDVGYIYIGDTDGYNPAFLMDSVLHVIGQHEAIIFDIRNNGGGDGAFAQGITHAFAQKTRLAFTSQTRNGSAYGDFDEKTEFYNISDNDNQYLKPIVLLTDAFTVSGAEHITMYLKTNTHITHVGDTTAGAFSSLSNRQFLPNGWSYRYPAQMYLDVNGKSLDGDGIIPDIYSKNTPENIGNEKDAVIERALQYLSDEYGI